MDQIEVDHSGVVFGLLGPYIEGYWLQQFQIYNQRPKTMNYNMLISIIPPASGHGSFVSASSLKFKIIFTRTTEVTFKHDTPAVFHARLENLGLFAIVTAKAVVWKLARKYCKWSTWLDRCRIINSIILSTRLTFIGILIARHTWIWSALSLFEWNAPALVGTTLCFDFGDR